MTPSARPADASRIAPLTMDRVERQQRLIELLCGTSRRTTLEDLGRELGVSARTVARDVERIRVSGVPLDVTRGRGGGVVLPRAHAPTPISLDVSEVAALLSSLVVLGPSGSPSATSALHKLVAALH